MAQPRTREELLARRRLERAAKRRQRLELLLIVLVMTGFVVGVVVFASRRHGAHREGLSQPETVLSGTAERRLRRPARRIVTLAKQTAPEVRTPAPGPLAAVRGRVVVIDPGHDGLNYAHASEINRLVPAGTFSKPCDTTGTETADGYTEAAYTLDVSLRLAAVLRRAGARVVLTRKSNDDWGPCVNERAAIGNRAGADVAISIHADGGPSTGRGFHVIYPPSIPGFTDDIAGASARLAVDIRGAYARGTRMPYSTYAGSQALDVRDDLAGLNLSDVPKVFIETGDMRNPTDAALLERASYRERAAHALASGIADFLAGR